MKRYVALLGGLLAFLWAAAAAAQAVPTLSVWTDARLWPLANEVAAEMEARGLLHVRFVVDTSPALIERMVTRGEHGDVLLVEGKEVVTLLVKNGFVPANDFIAVAQDRLALALPAEPPVKDPLDQLRRLKPGELGTQDPDTSQAGLHARQALKRLLGEQAPTGLRSAPSASALLNDVMSGRLKAAIAYASDLQATPSLRTGFIFPEISHLPILYYGGVFAASSLKSPARAFLSRLLGEAGRARLPRYGFVPPAVRQN